jgi:CDP-paratose 2-epimerase
MRRSFFGAEASTESVRRELETSLPGYTQYDVDVRDREAVDRIFRRHGRQLVGVVHTAAQPSHDWAARDPFTDFDINAGGTLNLLEATRRHCPDAAFLFTSTNKVYGDTPNRLPLVEEATRWEVAPDHPFAENGVDESMSIDRSLHSLFGVSKASADLLVQEYGRYFGLNSVCFRAGCVTGPEHAGAELHGFLAYLVRCAVHDREYTVFGYGGKQVRDNIHVADLVRAFWCYFESPRPGEVYNIGGGRFANCSMLEAMEMCEERIGRPLRHRYSAENRVGDHIWWVSDCRRFASHYPEWRLTFDIRSTIDQIYEAAEARRSAATRARVAIP